MEGDAGTRIEDFWRALEPEVRGARSLERAAQRFVERFYRTFGDFTALVRLFAVVPAQRLSAEDRRYLDESFAAAPRAERHDDRTPILTLLGTHGIAPEWNDRRASRNHRAIPLLSQAFIEEAPMIARLFSELGVPPIVDVRADWQYLQRLGDGDGLFFVGDARTSTDAHGRPIIPSIDFIERFGIKTVFGFGGPNPAANALVTIIVFCRRTISREEAIQFERLSGLLRDAYGASPAAGAMFVEEERA